MKVLKRITLCGLVAVVNFCYTASAQNCTGTVSTGQNLVTNGDFSQGYTGWSHDPAYTNYTPCAGCWSSPGNIYAGSVPQNFNAAFGNIQDHSPSGDNNFLMVDGICTFGIDLWKQTNIPIIPNTNYYFSVWITSLSPAPKGLAGTLNFNINGVDLPTTIAAPGVVGQWIRFPGVVWNSGLTPPSSISISIQNTTLDSCDKYVDFAIDDITFTQGCDFGVSGPTPNLGPDFALCGRALPFNINANFRAATAASPNLTYTWYKDGVQQTKGMGPSFYNYSVTGPGTYSVCVDSAGSCPILGDVVINNSTTPPTRAWSPDSVFCAATTSSIRLRVVGGSGSNLIWYSGSCGGTQVATNTTGAEVTIPAPSVTTTYFARWVSSGCSTTTCASVTINPVSSPVSSIAGPRQDLCKLTSATLAGNTASPSGATGLWSVVSGTGTITTPSDPHSTVTGLAQGDLVLKWTISHSPCVASSSQVTIHVDTLSTPGIKGGSATQCATSTGVVYSTNFNHASGSTYTWTTSLGGSLVITSHPNNTAIVDIGSLGGTLTVTETRGACSIPSSLVITSVPPNDPSPDAGPRQDLCNVNSATLAAKAASPSGASGLWSIVSGTGNLPSPANDPHATVTGLASGDLLLKWTISNGPCPNTSSQVTIHVDTLSIPGIKGDSATQCATATGVVYSTNINHSTGSTYTWTTSSGGSLVITSHPNNTAIVNIGALGGTLTVTETRGACSIPSNLNITSVQPNDPSPDAGPRQDLCNVNSATLAAKAASPSGASGLWSIVSGTGNLPSPANDPHANVTGLVPGDLILKWTISNGICPNTSSQVTIHSDTLSIPEITGASANQCATATGVVYSTSVNHIPVSSYTWSTSPAGSLVITSHPGNSAVVNIGTLGGTLTVTETRGACSANKSINVISVQPLDSTSAGIDQHLCNVNTATLSATAPAAPTVGFWQIINGTGTIPTSDLDKPNATVTGLEAGDLLLRWTIRNSPCADHTNDVIVHVDTLSAPEITGASFTQCSTATGVIYSTRINNSPANSYTWTTITPSTLVISGTSNNSAQVDIGSSGGILKVTETRGACNRYATTSITAVQPPDVSSAGTNQAICNLNSVTLDANTPTAPSKGTWEILSGTGIIASSDLSKPDATVSGLVAGNLILRWTIRNSPCADAWDTVIIHKDILSNPVLTGASFDTCAFTTSAIYSTTLDHSPANTYTWATSGVSNTLVISSTSGNNAMVEVGASGGTITVTEINGACSLSASKDIHTTPNITSADAGPDQSICVNTTTLQAKALSVGQGEWTVVSGSGIFIEASDPNTSVSGLTEGVTNTFRWTVKGCGGPLTDDVDIKQGPSDMIIGPLNGPTDTLCVGTPRMLTLSISGGSSHYFYVWKSSDSSFNTVITYTPVIVVPLVNTTKYIVYAVDSLNHGCKSNSDSIVVHAVDKQNLTMNNLMTPNSDNLNDKFIVRDIETLQKPLPGTKIDVFNEWGSRVYQSESYDNTWEGPGLTDGVYYYHLKAGCGTDVYKGWVQIVR